MIWRGGRPKHGASPGASHQRKARPPGAPAHPRLFGCMPWSPHSFSCRTPPAQIGVTAESHSPNEDPATAKRGARAWGPRSSQPQRLTFHQRLRRRLSLFTLLLLLFPRFLFAVAAFWVLFAFHLLGTHRHLNVKCPHQISPALPLPWGALRVSRQARRLPGGDANTLPGRQTPSWTSAPLGPFPPGTQVAFLFCL